MTEDEYGTLSNAGDRMTMRFRRRLGHPPTTVWQALTEPQHLEGWFPTTIDGDFVPGAALSFAFREVDMPPMDGEMLAFDPPRLLEFRWGPDTLRFELEADGEGCLLVLTDTYAEVGKGARDAAGWHICLQNLGTVVDGDEAPPQGADYWRSVNARYRKLFGPEASTLGPPQEWEDAQRSVD